VSEGYRPKDSKAAVLAFNEGADAMASGDEVLAVQAWRRALDYDACLIHAAKNLVTYYRKKADVRAELETWEIVLAFDPFDTDNLILQAEAFRRASELEKAVHNYEEAISVYPFFKFWYPEVGDLCEQLGRPEEAERWRERGRSVQADEAEICYEDGLQHVDAKRWESAKSCFQAILEDFPSNLDARLRLAKVLEFCGTTEAVHEHYNVALDLTESAKGLVHYRRAEFYLRRGQIAEAVASFKEAAASVPRFRKADKVIGTLEPGLDTRAAAAEAPAAAPAEVQPTPEAAVEAPASDSPARPTLSGWADSPPESPPAQPAQAPRAQVMRGGSGSFDSYATKQPRSLPLSQQPRGVATPQIRQPDPALPWQHQVKQVLDQVLAVAAPGGGQPRVALVVEPHLELKPVVAFCLSEFRAMGRSLMADQTGSDILVVETGRPDQNGASHPLIHGWVGRDDTAILQFSQWTEQRRPGLPLARTLHSVQQQSANGGFNCIIVICFGRRHPEDVDLKAVLQGTSSHCICYLHPRYHYIDFRLAVGDTVPNFIDIAV
jgi:tetratricopeptide (TPR) repeat protein